MITKDAIDRIAELAVKAESRIDPGATEPKGVYFIRQPDGSMEKVHAEPMPQHYEAFSLGDFAKTVATLRELHGSDDGDGACSVLCGRGKVQAVIDETDRRQAVTMPLTETEEFKRLKALRQSRTPLPHAAFLKLLRIDLATCVDVDTVNVFKAIKVKAASDGQSTVEHGRQSVGKSVLREISGADRLPEFVEVTVCVYDELALIEGYDRKVRCAVDIDLEAATFALIPLAGEIEQAQRSTDEAIRDELSTKISDALVVCGAVRG